MSPTSIGEIDLIAIERRTGGDTTVVLNRAEQVEAIRRMAAHGSSDTEIADAIGMSSRNVHRIRTTHGIPTTWSAP